MFSYLKFELKQNISHQIKNKIKKIGCEWGLCKCGRPHYHPSQQSHIHYTYEQKGDGVNLVSIRHHNQFQEDWRGVLRGCQWGAKSASGKRPHSHPCFLLIKKNHIQREEQPPKTS